MASYSRLSRVLTASTVLLLASATTYAAATPKQQCQAAKNKAAGKYAACRQGAEAKFVTTGDATKYGETLTKCGTKFTSVWQKAVAKAVSAGTTCLDDPLTEGDFRTVINEHTDNIATALAGGGLADCPADLATCAGDLATCQATPQGQRLKTGQTACSNASGTLIACAGTGQDGEFQKGLTRSYTDNGDGTITDNRTGLMWEKLSDDGSIHDWDTTYPWTNAAASKVATLNAGSFAGHTDWRVPNLNELQSLAHYGVSSPAVDAAFNTACAPGCTVTTCSCTRPAAYYWSSTTYQYTPSLAWVVISFDGNMNAYNKTDNNYVRAVRAGDAASTPTPTATPTPTVTSTPTTLCGDSTLNESCNGTCPANSTCTYNATTLQCECATGAQCNNGVCYIAPCQPSAPRCPPGYTCFSINLQEICQGDVCGSDCSCPSGGLCIHQ